MTSKTNSYDRLTLIELSDIHVGHPNTPVQNTINGLNWIFFQHERLADIDLVFIAGDFFDSLQHLPSPAMYPVRQWINNFLRACKEHDVVVRVLEGTASHDWRQSAEFIHENVNSKIGADVKFVTELSIERIERFGIDVMYLPDEWSPDPDVTWEQVVKLLAHHNLKQVDYTVMHGAFEYQLPEHLNLPTHSSERYSSITRRYVFCGHVHKRSQHGNILVAGSTDRLVHGEEEDKGYIKLQHRPELPDQIEFITNPHAQLYITIDCTGVGVDQIHDHVAARVAGCREGSFFRLDATGDEPLASYCDVMQREYPQYSWSVKINRKRVVERDVQMESLAKFRGVEMSANNIRSLMESRLLKNPSMTPDRVAKALGLLDQFI